MNKEDLINKVIEQIKDDFFNGDIEPIEELLKFIPVENLIGYLSEDEWKQFNHLVVEDYLQREKNDFTQRNRFY